MENSPVDRLKQRIDNTVAWREAEKRKKQDAIDRLRAFNDAPQRTMVEFWCDECKQDFAAAGYKLVANVINLKTGESRVKEPLRAWYEGKCPKEHRAIRRITDKAGDPYYHKSRIVRIQRERAHDDMLTPDDPRFRILYPDAWRKLEEQREERDRQERMMNKPR